MQGTVPSGCGAHVTPSPSIFVIEDNDEMRSALTSILRQAGYQVQASENGRAALEVLDQADPPDLFVLDLVMPQMSGWEFRVAQRRTPHLADVPVIVLSADRSAQAKAIDADAYLPKPFDAKSFLHAVELRLLKAERRRLESRAAELDRLSSIGVLAAGIAHEVNNPLAVVAGNLELATKLLERRKSGDVDPALVSNERIIALLRDASSEAARVAAVARSVATFSHPEDARASVVNVGDVLESSIRLVTNEIRHRAKLVWQCDDRLRVLCNPAQLAQVFVNILINAAHAIKDGAPEHNLVRVTGWRTREGRTIVEISDTGVGIALEHLSRIFDPFFTTKSIGVGVGLGLAISQRLVASWGGVITVDSNLGEGARFRVELPSYDAPLLSSPPDPGGAPGTAPTRGRVLVVDDEPLICTLIMNMLEDKLDIVTCTSAREALALLRNDPEFDVILTDLMMPDLTGMDLCRELARDNPLLSERVLFMTGGTFTDRVEHFLDARGVAPLLKPFSADEALSRLTQFMKASRAQGSSAKQAEG